MLHIDSTYIQSNGGFLHAIRKKSNRYIRSILEKNNSLKPEKFPFNKLDRTISHAHPHLDEYYADLIFRSTLPDYKLDIDFMEVAVHSKTDDAACKAYWPNAAVFGIGGTASGGTRPLLLFDEHVAAGKRSDDSCSQMVIDETLNSYIPLSINRILREVNEIDSNGGAHNQHIGNIIKTAHLVRLLIENGEDESESTFEMMNAEWKKTIMDASMTSVIYCLENHINLKSFTAEMDKSLRKSLSRFIEFCGYQHHPYFTETITWMKNSYYNQPRVFKDAKLPQSGLKDQFLIIGRVCYTLEYCWGETISNIIMMHFWEIIYQSQCSFEQAQIEIQLNLSNDGIFQSDFGTFEKHSLMCRNGEKKELVWFIKLEPTPKFIRGHRAVTKFIKAKNGGRGIILVEDQFNCTKTILKGEGIDQDIWELLVDIIKSLEPECWHSTYSNNSRHAPFLVNNNASNKYAPQSNISLVTIYNIFNDILQ